MDGGDDVRCDVGCDGDDDGVWVVEWGVWV